MGKRFSINVLGQFNHCPGVGAEWNQSDGSVTLTQTAMVNKLLEYYDMTNAVTAATPIEVGFDLEPTLPKDESIPHLKLGS